MDLVGIIKMSVSTLNTVEVHGEENLSAMLGVITALKTVANAMEQPPASPEQDGPTVIGVNGESPAMENVEAGNGE